MSNTSTPTRPRRRRRRLRPSSGRRTAPTAIFAAPLLLALALGYSFAGPELHAVLLHDLADPNLSLPLLLAGILLLYLEFNRPGTVLPAALGTLCAALALFGLAHLPLSPVALVAIAVALALLALELLLPLRNFAVVTSAAVLAFGLARLVQPTESSTPAPPAVHPAVALGTAFLCVSVTFSLVRIALRARRQKMTPARIQLVTANPTPSRHDGVN